MKISTKIVLMLTASLALLTIALGIISTYFTSDIVRFFSNSYTSDITKVRKQELKDEMRIVNHVLEKIYHDGKQEGLSDEGIQKRIYSYLRDLRFYDDDSGYILYLHP